MVLSRGWAKYKFKIFSLAAYKKRFELLTRKLLSRSNNHIKNKANEIE